MQKITTYLWFDDQAEEAAQLYTAIFKNSRITNVTPYSDEAADMMGKPRGSAMTVNFELGGHKFIALNGGPMYKFTEAISLVIDCDDQSEVDYFWGKLTENGGEPGRCCWLKDKFGVSWQVVPKQLAELLSSKKTGAAARVGNALMKMDKPIIADLQAAHDQE